MFHRFCKTRFKFCKLLTFQLYIMCGYMLNYSQLRMKQYTAYNDAIRWENPLWHVENAIDISSDSFSMVCNFFIFVEFWKFFFVQNSVDLNLLWFFGYFLRGFDTRNNDVLTFFTILLIIELSRIWWEIFWSSCRIDWNLFYFDKLYVNTLKFFSLNLIKQYFQSLKNYQVLVFIIFPMFKIFIILARFYWIFIAFDISDKIRVNLIE